MQVTKFHNAGERRKDAQVLSINFIELEPITGYIVDLKANKIIKRGEKDG